jgi:hypothetical protein
MPTKKKADNESEIFYGSKVGRTASVDSALKRSYTVKGSYLDANGCMKTYGTDLKGRDQESFISDTTYED